PSATGVKIVDEDELGTPQAPEPIIASVAVSDGRVYLVSDSNLYAIGKKTRHQSVPVPALVPSTGTPTYAQVVPTELMLKPGDKVNFRVRLFDAQGNFIREEPSATWSIEQLKGTVENGHFTAGNESVAQA